MASQFLYLSSNEPWKASYTTEEGYTLYKVDSTSMLTAVQGAQVIKISRAIPSIASAESGSEDVLRESFAHLAEIEYRPILATRIRYGGKEKSVDEFFKKGLGFLKRKYVFVGPNGKEYIWELGSLARKLFVSDSDKSLVAIFHRKQGGLIREPRPAYLEIFNEGQKMLDLIVITFVYMERLLKESG